MSLVPFSGGSPGILCKAVGHPSAYDLRNPVEESWRIREYLTWIDWVVLSWSLTLVTVLATVCTRFWTPESRQQVASEGGRP